MAVAVRLLAAGDGAAAVEDSVEAAAPVVEALEGSVAEDLAAAVQGEAGEDSF